MAEVVRLETNKAVVVAELVAVMVALAALTLKAHPMLPLEVVGVV